MATMTAASERGSEAALDLPYQLVSLLQTPQAYREKTAAVELIETHISWVFLTDRFAYKLKKPVRFDFLDFSTPDLRRQACEHEVSLNRRLAPGVYLGVVPIVRTMTGRLAVGREGVPVDWLVKMRRLPADRALDMLIRDGKIAGAEIGQLAKTLSEFYENLPPVTVTVDSYRRTIEQHTLANRDELAAGAHHLDLAKLRRVHAAQLRLLKLAPDLLDDRVRNGRIVEGHGDLRPEHIYFSPSPAIIDCIEFNEEFRTLDVADELAFLSMECDFLGAPGITAPIIERYMEQSSDHPPRPLMEFYRLYRACVRAKVCALRAEQLSGEARARWIDAASKYLDLADRYTRSLGPPVLILMRGLPGTGKSTIAQTISEALGVELLQTDSLRQTMFGPTGDRAGFNQGRYQAENRLRVYGQMHTQADAFLKDGRSVVLDGTYLAASSRADAAKLAERNQAAFLAVHCQCPDEIALQRIESRAAEGKSSSEAHPEFFERQRQAEEPDPPEIRSLSVETSSGIVEPMKDIFETLRTILLE
jgi:aminoglycoside phosphotransferase family enzyme/predicted kinase